MTKIKICGLTNMEDALHCVRLGVDYLGFIFADSPRSANPRIVREIVGKIGRKVKTVGVFTQEDDEVIWIADYCNLDYIQLHANQSEDFAQKIGRERVIRVLKVSREAAPTLQLSPEKAAFYLFDTYSKVSPGGTGIAWDWDKLSGCDMLSKNAFIAGGLTPENVAAVIEKLRPYAVDVSSGVEELPGKKDPLKIERLVENVRTYCNAAR